MTERRAWQAWTSDGVELVFFDGHWQTRATLKAMIDHMDSRAEAVERASPKWSPMQKAQVPEPDWRGEREAAK